jgi:hypothetical protein
MQAHTILASLLLIALSHAQNNDANNNNNNKPLTRVDVLPSACTTTAVPQPREETPSKKKRQLKPLDLLCGKTALCGSAIVDVRGDQLKASVSSAADWTIGKIHVRRHRLACGVERVGAAAGRVSDSGRCAGAAVSAVVHHRSRSAEQRLRRRSGRRSDRGRDSHGEQEDRRL